MSGAEATARDLIDRDASVGIRNPKRRRHERKEVFEDTYRRYIRSEDEYASRIDSYDAAIAAEGGG